MKIREYAFGFMLGATVMLAAGAGASHLTGQADLGDLHADLQAIEHQLELIRIEIQTHAGGRPPANSEAPLELPDKPGRPR